MSKIKVLYDVFKTLKDKEDQLFSSIWGEEDFGDTATVAVHIQKIRKKIEKTPVTQTILKQSGEQGIDLTVRLFYLLQMCYL